MNSYSRVYVVQDDDGDWYVIPFEEKERFHLCLNELITSEYDLDLLEVWEEEFGHYRTGGDLNLVELYGKD